MFTNKTQSYRSGTKHALVLTNRYALSQGNYSGRFRLRRLRRRGGGEERGHPAPRQGARKAPWNPLPNRYITGWNVFRLRAKMAPL